jgi:hypothetical protein
MPTRLPFSEAFQELPDGSLSPKQPIEVGGTRFGPGVIFTKGVAFGGIDFQLFRGRDLAVELQPDGTLRLIGFYNG